MAQGAFLVIFCCGLALAAGISTALFGRERHRSNGTWVAAAAATIGVPAGAAATQLGVSATEAGELLAAGALVGLTAAVFKWVGSKEDV